MRRQCRGCTTSSVAVSERLTSSKKAPRVHFREGVLAAERIRRSEWGHVRTAAGHERLGREDTLVRPVGLALRRVAELARVTVLPFNKIKQDLKNCHSRQKPRWQVGKEAIGLSRIQHF